LQTLGVKEFKEALDTMRKNLDEELSTMRTKLKLNKKSTCIPGEENKQHHTESIF